MGVIELNDGLSPRAIASLAANAEAEAKRRAASFRWNPSAATATPPARGTPMRHGGAPLRVLVADDEGSAFQWIDDPRAELFGPADPRAAQPDIVVLTRIDRLNFDRSAASVPEEVWRRLASGGAKLVLDASSEGNAQTPKRTAAVHGFLESRGVAVGDAAYITQDRGYADAYAARCAELGLDARRMQVWVHDRHIRSTFARYFGDGGAAFHQRLELYAATKDRRPRRFISLNHTLRPTKAMFLLRLLGDGMWDKGYISLGPADDRLRRLDPEPRRRLKRLRKDLPGFDDLIDELAPLLERLEALPPNVVGAADWRATPRAEQLKAPPFPEYQESWFTVVAETEMTDRLHRITEKPFKPLLNFHPMILLASRGSLGLVRGYGFETFPGFFDESYDDEPKLRRRFDLVYDQVARLCAADEAELARRNEAAAEAVVFNAYWGMVELPRLFRSHIDAALVDRLVQFARTEPAVMDATR